MRLTQLRVVTALHGGADGLYTRVFTCDSVVETNTAGGAESDGATAVFSYASTHAAPTATC